MKLAKKEIAMLAALALAITAISAALTWPTPAAAQTAAQERTVVTQGVGSISMKPDLAKLSVGVTIRNKSAKTAQAEVGKIADAMIKAARDKGLKDADILTSGVSLRPAYDYNSGTSKLSGYDASYTLMLTISDLSKVGEMLDSQVEAGANNNVSLTFHLKNDDAAYKKALEAAVADAKSKATVLAAATGGKLGEVITATEGGSGYYPMYRAEASMMAMAADAGTPIVAESVEVSASVSITYELVK